MTENTSSSVRAHADEVVVHRREARIPGAPTRFEKLVFENSEIIISFLPGAGGRVYEFIDKSTGTNQFYTNTIWKESLWGGNSCRKEGWKAIGGLEFSFPVDEHGCVYDRPFEHTLIRQDDGGQSIQMWIGPSPETRHLELIVKVTVHPNANFFRIDSIVRNPSQTTQEYQFWANAMLTPGGEDPRRAGLEFFLSDDVTSVLFHGGEGLKKLHPDLKPKGEIPWLAPIRFYDRTKDVGHVGMFANPSSNYQAVYSHTQRHGVLRLFESPQGAKIFTPGPVLHTAYSDTDRQYVEIWSGVSRDFWTDRRIEPSQEIRVSEVWFTLSGLKPGEWGRTLKEITDKRREYFPKLRRSCNP